jgi:hypothetical protein
LAYKAESCTKDRCKGRRGTRCNVHYYYYYELILVILLLCVLLVTNRRKREVNGSEWCTESVFQCPIFYKVHGVFLENVDVHSITS